MPLVLIAPLLALATLAAASSWLAASVARATADLHGDLAVLAQLRAARDLLAHDLDRTRTTLDRPAPGRPGDVSRRGGDR